MSRGLGDVYKRQSKFNEGQEVAHWKEDERNINEGYPILNWQN